ncbi:flocculation protein FLO11-like isoform X2 [Gambusia affinis]|uniref:flocculation protein FLO11-like isoform X2 n=1 Tax=Gambusia affinis TaxID=33528 RepID=UPI001CDCEF6D|nr:flocculation protein FLO11-like isoform X2 [Gambusia affinis]
MELPLGGPALRHYTQSRPRPHRQKLNYRPSRPQETIIESENEVLEHMGRVDEGVEEFFTKKVLPTDTLTKQDEETITQQEVAPASAVAPCPPPTKTLRRKLGDFFTLKRKRGLKSEPSQEGRPKKASIADFIRPLREVARSEKDKEKERVKEHDKENEKDKAKAHPSAVTGEAAVQETEVTGDAPLRGEAAPPRRALREGKSQSLILLSGSAAAAGATNARNTAKKQFEGQHSFEQKLHLMLQRIGVSKPPPGDTQSQEGEMKKAESEGTIIDNKPEPPSTFSKPRTMSASSDTRHQIRASLSAHEAAGKPALLPKPVIKPAPPPATSGRNTPENELAQIQEAETNTPTKPSLAAALSAPTTTSSSVPTISNSVPDSASVTVSSSSTDTEICIDSVDSAAATTTPTSIIASDSKTSVPKSSSPVTEAPTSTITSISTQFEPPGTAALTPTPSESTTPSPSVTSTSKTETTSSIPTLETGSAPCQQSPVCKTATNLPTEASSLEPNGALSAAGGDVSVSTTASSSTSVTDSGLHTPSSRAVATCHPPDSGAVTTADTHGVSVTSTSPATPAPLPPTGDETLSPPSSDHMDSASSPATVQSAAPFSAPSTSSSDTNPTDTASTATSLNRADTTSTSSSAGAAAISSPHITGSDPAFTIPPDVELSATPRCFSSPAPPDGEPHQDKNLQTLHEERREGEEEPGKPTTTDTVDKPSEEVKQPKSGVLDEKEEDVHGEKKSESNSDKPLVDNGDVTRKEVQEESVRAEENAPSAPDPGAEGERSRDDTVNEAQEQEETTSAGDK